MDNVKNLNSIGVIARAVGIPIHQARYWIGKLGLRPIGRVGISYLYDDDATGRIAEAVAARKELITERTHS